MAIPALIGPDGALTADGRKVVNFIEANLADVTPGCSPDVFNAKAGVFKYYWTTVKATQSHTPERFLEEFKHTAAANAYNLMLAAEEADRQAQKLDEAVETSSKVTEALEALKQVVDAQAAEIKALKEAAKKPAAKPKKVETTEPADEADADEDEAE